MNTITIRLGWLVLIFSLNQFVSAELNSEDNFFDMSLAELSDTLISGISRKKQSSFTSTSANYVITQDDIRHSGMTSLPELLRMIPGMHVGQQNGTIWAINARSPNKRLSRDLLVMIDGRSVYTPLFNGVYWNRVDTLLEDIERIEIIRGPGSSLWGANASNGIINIVTKKADKTQGLAVNMTGGTKQLDHMVNVRYGFSGENHDSRFYIKQTRLKPSTYPPAHDNQSQAQFPSGKTAFNTQHFIQTGFRSDIFLPSSQQLTIQGDYYKNEEKETRLPQKENTMNTRGMNILSRYNHQIDDESSVILQLYFDLTKTKDQTFINTIKTYDFDLSHNFSLTRQEIIWGFGFRLINNHTKNMSNRGGLALDPQNRTTKTYSFFIEDDLSLIEDKLTLILGSKFEKNDYTHYEFQPSIKLGYKHNENTFLWASIGRAVSIPSRISADGYLDFNLFNGRCSPTRGFTDDPKLGCIIEVSTPKLEASTLQTIELGYRQKINKYLAIDNALFYNNYNIKGLDGFTYTTYGYEGVIDYQVTNDWKLEASWTYHQGKDSANSDQADLLVKHSGFIRSNYQLNHQIDVDLNYYYISAIRKQNASHRVDLRIAYRPIKDLELSLTASNLLDPKHTEGNIDPRRINTNVERAVMAKISYQFK